MVDWLVVWGVTQTAGLVFKPILEDLAKESVKDYAKDFFKDCLKKVIHLPEKDVQKEAYGKALKEFFHLVQQELQNAGYQDAQLKQFIPAVKQFIEQADVAAVLGRAFEAECRAIDTRSLKKTWDTLNLPYLPDDFDWELVSKLYVRAVKKIIQESETLRPIFIAQAQAAIASGVQELAGIPPDYNLGRYAEGLREQYGTLKLESLDTTGVYYNELKLWKVFVPQKVRECQKFLPQVYEIPKEHGRRLRESGQLDEAELVEVELERSRRVYGEQPIRPVLEVVGDPRSPVGANGRSPLPQVVILGDPGSGKSTLLQYVALIWAERPLKDLPLYPIPLMLELRTYARDKQTGKCKDILSFIHAGNITQELPRDRPELYNQASRVLLHQWDVERALVEDQRLDPKTIDYRDKQAMLRKVAYHMQSSEKGLAGNIISASDLETILADYLRAIEIEQPIVVARLMIQQLRTRNFILCYLGAESYAFVHRTFLEYFCAWEFVWQFKETQTLTVEQLKLEVFGNHWQDESWHEVLRLIAGMIDARFVAEIVNYLIKQIDEEKGFINLFLAAECYGETKNRDVFGKEMINHLLEKLKGLVNYYKSFQIEQFDCEEGEVIRTIPGDVSQICTRALLIVSDVWKGNEEIRSWLLDIICSDNWVVKTKAVQALAIKFKDDPKTLLVLRNLAQRSDSLALRLAAVDSLAEGWQKDSDLLGFLCVCATDNFFARNRHSYLEEAPRKLVLKIILKNYPDHPQIWELLSDRAQNDPDEQVREFATQKLAELENLK